MSTREDLVGGADSRRESAEDEQTAEAGASGAGHPAPPVAVITGAARGIGRVVAGSYLEAGYRVAGIDRVWPDRSGEGENSVGVPDGTLRITADVSRPEDIDRAVAEIVARWGRIDVLVNNAGFGIRRPPSELSVEEWDAVINTNLRGTFLMSRVVARVMRREHAGAIVNIASTRALMSEPDSEAYAASKGGIVALTHALAASYSTDGIRVNCISPGWIETGDYSALSEEDHRQHWSGRVGRPEDIAGACLFLTAPGNGFITGTNLVVDGGMTRRMIYEE
jgi:NAD(P)-dependent dehydrogenase (short-subunit alcohol dehydrogenase family)